MKIVIIGLEKRVDRWKRCEEILEREGLEAIHYKTVIHEHKHREATKDFLKMLRTHGNEELLFFEDDFELTEGWRDVFQRGYSDLPVGWDLMYLGANLTTTAKKVTDNLVKVKGAWMFHAALMSRKFIDYLLKYYDANKYWVFDEWLRRAALYQQFYMTYPMISYQRAGWSDFNNKETFYDIFNNKYYKTL